MTATTDALPSTTATMHTALRRHVPFALADRLTAQVRSTGGERETTRAPFTGETLLTYPLSSLQDVDDAFAAAREAQVAWGARPPAQRAMIIGRIHDMALARQDELLDLLQLEAGKARYDAFLEALAVAAYSRYNSRVAAEALAPKKRRGIVPGVTKARELRHPLGVVGLVTAWNYPATFASADGFAALLGGNAVVHRPDVQSALSATWVRSLAVEAGLPPELWQIVLGPGRSVGNRIVEQADAVAFTGSTQTGRTIAAQTGARLVYTSLELGGKNPFVVLADADLDRAADAAVRACFTNAGQSCVGPERILVDTAVYDQFRERLLDRVGRMKVGGVMGYGVDMGPVIDRAQFDTVVRHVDDAIGKGARALIGGRPLPELGPYFYAPTVLEGVTEQMEACTKETFGPVVSLYRFESLDEAVDRSNDTEFGLHAVIWTRDTRLGEALAARIKAGTVEINDGFVATWGSADLPQGGMKASGMGRRNGTGGILRFTQQQSVLVQRVHGVHPPVRVSKEQFAKVTTLAFKALHALPRP